MKELKKKKNAGKYSHLTEQRSVKTRTYIQRRKEEDIWVDSRRVGYFINYCKFVMNELLFEKTRQVENVFVQVITVFSLCLLSTAFVDGFKFCLQIISKKPIYLYQQHATAPSFPLRSGSTMNHALCDTKDINLGSGN